MKAQLANIGNLSLLTSRLARRDFIPLSPGSINRKLLDPIVGLKEAPPSIPAIVDQIVRTKMFSIDVDIGGENWGKTGKGAFDDQCPWTFDAENSILSTPKHSVVEENQQSNANSTIHVRAVPWGSSSSSDVGDGAREGSSSPSLAGLQEWLADSTAPHLSIPLSNVSNITVEKLYALMLELEEGANQEFRFGFKYAFNATQLRVSRRSLYCPLNDLFPHRLYSSDGNIMYPVWPVDDYGLSIDPENGAAQCVYALTFTKNQNQLVPLIDAQRDIITSVIEPMLSREGAKNGAMLLSQMEDALQWDQFFQVHGSLGTMIDVVGAHRQLRVTPTGVVYKVGDESTERRFGLELWEAI